MQLKVTDHSFSDAFALSTALDSMAYIEQRYKARENWIQAMFCNHIRMSLYRIAVNEFKAPVSTTKEQIIESMIEIQAHIFTPKGNINLYRSKDE